MKSVLLLAAALVACSRQPEPERPYYRGDAAYDPPPAAATPPEIPQATDPAVLAKLAPLAASASADGAAWSLSFTADEFVSTYEHYRKEFAAVQSPHDAKIAGLPEPEIVDFAPGEREKGARTRWTDSAGVQYGEGLPRDGSAVTEAWTRVYGFRDLSVGNTMITQNGVAAEKWRRILWQPNKKRWSYFTEEYERMIFAAMVNGELSKPRPDDKNSARFDCERLQPAVEKARAEGRPFTGYQGTMKAAIIRSYAQELKLLAAQSLIE